MTHDLTIMGSPDFSILKRAQTLEDFIALTSQVWEEWGKSEEPMSYDRTSLLMTWRGSPYYHQAAQQISRALRAGRAYDLTGKQWQETLDHFCGQCAYCGTSLDLFEMDHVFPFQFGGGFTAANMIPSCMECNRRKKNRSLEECLDLGHITFETYSKIWKWQLWRKNHDRRKTLDDMGR